MAYSYVTNYNGANQASVNVVLNTANAYEYEIVYRITPSIDDANIYFRVTNDNFATVESGSVYWDNAIRLSSTTASQSGAGSTKRTFFGLGINVGNAGGEQIMGVLRVSLPHDTTKPTLFVADQEKLNGTMQLSEDMSSGTYDVSEAINGIQLYSNSGNISYDIEVFAKTT